MRLPLRAALPLILSTLASAAMAAHHHKSSPLTASLNANWSISGAGRSVTSDLPIYALEALVADGQVPDPLHG